MKINYLCSSYMLLNIFLALILVILLFNLYSRNQEAKSLNIKVPHQKRHVTFSDEPEHIRSDILRYDKTDKNNVHLIEAKKLSKEKCNPFFDENLKKTEEYQNAFFGFQNRLYCNSHLGDPVDNMNISGLTGCGQIGQNISDIYDDLVNSNEYKQ